MRIAYLFSRYPVVSQTFVDTEILALERMGVELELYSIYPPPTSFRHGHASRMKAPIHYAPPQRILKLQEEDAKISGRWPKELVDSHDRKYGSEYKAALRARNALYFADLFKARGITHFHVHFANRAAHTALFLKAISGLPFSMSTHGQDYMVDLGNHDLLREICREAVFVANETAWSTGELRKLCPDSEDKMFRVFNGMDLSNFQECKPDARNGVPRIVSIGRLIEFKGFHHLISACGKLKAKGLKFDCEIIGEGPWRNHLHNMIEATGLGGIVRLTGSLPQEEVFQRLKGADIFTLPCVVDEKGASDVFPTVILEAMASARPVVSTRLAGVPEQIVDGETGFICEPDDVAGLAVALEKLLSSPDLRVQFGVAGQKRLCEEFAVDNTVRVLQAQYEKFIKPAPPAPKRDSGLAFLLQEWPGAERHETELRQLAETFPNYRAYAVHSGAVEVPEHWRKTLPHIEFAPDGMVIEGEWQQERGLARQIETWRGEFGQKLASETFLQHARYALYLRHAIKRDSIRHLHAASSRELLVAWILHKLCGVTISVSLEEKAIFPAVVLTRILRDSKGVRIASQKIADTLDLTPGKGKEKSHQPMVLIQKTARAFEKEWIEKLGSWSVGKPAS